MRLKQYGSDIGWRIDLAVQVTLPAFCDYVHSVTEVFQQPVIDECLTAGSDRLP